MSDYGYQPNIGQVGVSLQLIASDMHNVRWKVGGVTIDWDTITAVVADTLLPGGTTIKAGQKYIPLGTILAVETSGGNAGKYGPHLTTATDGRQTLTRSKCFLLNEDISENTPFGLLQGNASDHPGVFDGGTIWRSRLLVGGTGQATLANFLAAFPAIDFADM